MASFSFPIGLRASEFHPALCKAPSSPQAFLTKSGDVGIVLAIEGVDYECLDPNTIDNVTRRPGSALRLFDEKCRIYQ
jgi:hypothetical protein